MIARASEMSEKLTLPFRPPVIANPHVELTVTSSAVVEIATTAWTTPVAVVVPPVTAPAIVPPSVAMIAPRAAPASAEIRRPDTVTCSGLTTSEPDAVIVKKVPPDPMAAVAPSDPGAVTTGEPVK